MPADALSVELLDSTGDPAGDPGAVTIELSGEIDAATAPRLVRALAPHVGTCDVVVRMRGIEFMDSSGVRVLVDAHRAATAGGHRLVIDQPSRRVRRILELSGLTQHFEIRDVEV